MKPHWHRAPLILAAFAMAVFWTGCSSDNPVKATGFTQTDADDIASQAGQAMKAGALTTMSGADGASGGVSGSPAASFNPGRLAAGIAAAETTFTNGGITYTLGVTFFDANGNELPGYGPLAHRMLVTTRATGDIATQQFTASLGHAGSLDVTGIEATEDSLTFQGACNDSVDASFQSLDGQRTRTFHWLSSAILANVKALKDRQVNPYPLSGTATFIVHAERFASNQSLEVDRVWDATVVVVFNGTANPELTVNGSFHYTVNLNTGVVARM